MSALAAFHVAAGALLAAIFVQTLLNTRATPRLDRMPPVSRGPRAAVLLPARNEARHIEATVRDWCAQDYADYEVIVYDDASDDATGPLAAAAGGERVRVVRGEALPAGWRGKPHALHRLREQTDAELLIFADADVRPAAQALSAAVSALTCLDAGAVSALPRHVGRASLLALVGIQNWAPLAFVPLWLASAARRPLFTVTNGQFLAVRADAYDRAGGFGAVRAALGEDAAFGRRLARHGHVVALVDGSALLRCRAYESFGACWNANVRNLRAAVLDSWPLLVMGLGILTALTLGPLAILVAGLTGARVGTTLWTWLPLGELTVAVGSRAVSDVRAGQAGWWTLLHPLAVGTLLAMALDAWRRSARGRPVTWKGRSYRVGPE